MTRFTSTDPATEATNWEGEAASAAQVQAAVDAARTAFPAWADAPRADRIDAVKRYQADLKDRASQIAEAIAREIDAYCQERRTNRLLGLSAWSGVIAPNDMPAPIRDEGG